MQAVSNYFHELNAAVGSAWNRFWFTPSSARLPAALRIAVGLLAFYAIATYGQDLNVWFGADGMLPQPLINDLYHPPEQWLSLRSVLEFLPPAAIWPFYWTSLVIIALFTLGVGGRIMAIAATVAVISMFARAPLLTGQFEPILAMLMVYLCISRCGDALSISTYWRKPLTLQPPTPSLQPASPFNTVSVRLIQLHIALIHLMMGLAQLAAPDNAWWSGEGIWLAIARPGMSLVDLSYLADHPRIIAAWSHAMTIYLLAFPGLVWKPLARPLVLAAGAVIWVSFAIASGWVMFCLAMLAGLAAFLGPPRQIHPQPQG